ncbi:MAG: 50S ribosomal protein L32 [Omnitrophica WOR_2 bacterium RIFCSPHIGHO2_02_FULL_68_15]|nr:MAG: 50S ribosomal protein L32 [Omnitrophica WOR_2 bacterium RIFCSPHIGHO2_02_FULL_68_15]
MALPKRRFSRARRDKRRTQQHVPGVPTLTTCPQCAAPVVAHHLCPSCGTYRGRQMQTVKTEKKDSAR